MWSERRLVELFEIEHPIVLAPMAGLGTVDPCGCGLECRWPRLDRLRDHGA
jgi:hypothetical protein